MSEIEDNEKRLTKLRAELEAINGRFQLIKTGKEKTELDKLITLREQVERQLVSAEAKQCRLEIESKQRERVQTNVEREALDEPIRVARDKFQTLWGEAQDAYVAYQSLDIRAITLEDKSQILFEDIGEAKRKLGQLVSQFVSDSPVKSGQ